MVSNKLAALIAATVAVSGALAQQPAPQPAKKPAKATPATKAPAPEPAASKPAPPPPPPPPFAPVRWQADAPITTYAPNEAAKVYEWISAQIAAVPGKPDQFSTTDERRTYETALADKLKAIGPLAAIHPCTKKYNGDQQAYEVSVGGFSITDPSLRDLNPESLRLRRVLIGRGEVVKDTYTGQNAYGANTEISRTVAEMFVLAFTSDLYNDPNSVWVQANTGLKGSVPYRLNYGAYTFSVPMPPADAREQDKNISCLSVFTVASPGAFKFTDKSRPTRDMPFDTTTNYKALMGTLDMLAVVNTATGQVYAKATRQGFPAQ